MRRARGLLLVLRCPFLHTSLAGDTSRKRGFWFSDYVCERSLTQSRPIIVLANKSSPNAIPRILVDDTIQSAPAGPITMVTPDERPHARAPRHPIASCQSLDWVMGDTPTRWRDPIWRTARTGVIAQHTRFALDRASCRVDIGSSRMWTICGLTQLPKLPVAVGE